MTSFNSIGIVLGVGKYHSWPNTLPTLSGQASRSKYSYPQVSTKYLFHPFLCVWFGPGQARPKDVITYTNMCIFHIYGIFKHVLMFANFNHRLFEPKVFNWCDESLICPTWLIIIVFSCINLMKGKLVLVH